MVIKAIIVDDEVHVRESLQRLIQKKFAEEIEIKDSVSSVKEAVKAINVHNPNLVFLDIELQGESGFSLLEYFQELKFHIIVTTSYPQYAIDAIKNGAFDFLVKPIRLKELGDAIERFKKHKTNVTDYKIATFIDNVENDLEINKKILFPSKNTYHIEKINNILYCKADVNYCYIYTLTKDPYLITTTLKHLQDLLPNKLFFRTHKSYLVNLNHIVSFNKKEMTLLLDKDQVVKVAHRRADKLLHILYG